MENIKNNTILYAIDGGGVADLVDHFMSSMVYKIVELIKTIPNQVKVCVVSGDKAAWCTKICLEYHLKSGGVSSRVYVVTQV